MTLSPVNGVASIADFPSTVDYKACIMRKITGDGYCLYRAVLSKPKGKLPPDEDVIDLNDEVAAFLSNLNDKDYSIPSIPGVCLKDYVDEYLRTTPITVDRPNSYSKIMELPEFVEIMCSRQDIAKEGERQKLRPYMYAELGTGIGWAIATLLNVRLLIYDRGGYLMGVYLPLPKANDNQPIIPDRNIYLKFHNVNPQSTPNHFDAFSLRSSRKRVISQI